jgi:ribonucleoside-diphosphate reductase alpha chain
MGFHSYLQKLNVAFESNEAAAINRDIFSIMQEQAIAESIAIGKEKGEAPDMEGTGRRNAHLLAIAPNANSSIIANTSPSIEPWKANAYTHRTRAGSHLVKNPYLEKVLEGLGKNTQDIWSSIITNGGSVQHLDFLSEHQKKVFKTAIEIHQDWVVYHGGVRQEFLCQGQSLNIFFPAGASKKYLHKTHFDAWKYGCKGLYYLRTETSNRAENVALKIERDRLVEFNETASQDECVACQG